MKIVSETSTAQPCIGNSTLCDTIPISPLKVQKARMRTVSLGDIFVSCGKRNKLTRKLSNDRGNISVGSGVISSVRLVAIRKVVTPIITIVITRTGRIGNLFVALPNLCYFLQTVSGTKI